MSELSAVEARRAYDEYFRMCVLHPDLTSYDSARRNLGVPTPNRLWASYSTAASQYTWFVAYALKVFDDLLEHDREGAWKKPVKFQLEMHAPTLAAIWAEHWQGLYNGELGRIVDEVIEALK